MSQKYCYRSPLPCSSTLLRQCLSLKLELDDAKASCELQKVRVKDLVARKVSTIVGDEGAASHPAEKR